MSRVDEIAEDAARYRWLRDRDLDAIEHGGLFVGMVPENIVINGDDLDRRVDAARAATTAILAHSAPDAPAIWPAVATPAILEVLGLMNFITGSIAHGFREAGHDIPRKCEAEQAFVLHRFIGHALRHGANWRHAAGEDIQAAVDAARARKDRADFAEAHEEAIEQERKGG